MDTQQIQEWMTKKTAKAQGGLEKQGSGSLKSKSVGEFLQTIDDLQRPVQTETLQNELILFLFFAVHLIVQNFNIYSLVSVYLSGFRGLSWLRAAEFP